jgi:hypothetical protein
LNIVEPGAVGQNLGTYLELSLIKAITPTFVTKILLGLTSILETG